VPGRRAEFRPPALRRKVASAVRLELRGITKRFGDLVANDSIDLTVEPGEIHALLGENGAGKSTLMNVLYGLLQPDAGQVLVDGEPHPITGPGDAIAAGIGMVHQHFMLVPVFTVAENVMLGVEETRGRTGLLDRQSARKRVRELSDRYHLAVDPDAVVEHLPVGVQQRVEILKALLRNADVLVLDEPTAVLTPAETEDLFVIMRELRERGHSVVFITHKLKEVQAVADRITVIRRGHVIGTVGPETSEADLAAMMVGRDVKLTVDKGPGKPGAPVLRLDGLTVFGEGGQPVVDHVDLEVRAGEILAIAGVQGNGQTELVEALLGLRPVDGGTATLDGRPLTGRRPRKVLEAGVGFVPEDRREDGLVGNFTVSDNLVLDLYYRSPFGSGIALRPSAIHDNAVNRVEEFDVRTPSVELPASSLSGGNQQKVVLARELSRPLRLFIASQPTRGLDIGSIEFVHKRIVRERDQGTAVLIVSSELDEVLALADRVAVIYRGRIVGLLDAGQATRERVGLLMAGAA
jgi:general nucleoside transport system ATP-binding protein